MRENFVRQDISNFTSKYCSLQVPIALVISTSLSSYFVLVSHFEIFSICPDGKRLSVLNCLPAATIVW